MGSEYRIPRLPGTEKKRSRASNETEKQRARRKTPFTNAARISARCQPYVYLSSASDFAAS